jgi:hypothetical protein
MYEIKQIFRDKPFVREIESLSEEKRKAIFLRNCKVILTDFSSLYIKEISRMSLNTSVEFFSLIRRKYAKYGTRNTGQAKKSPPGRGV